MKETPSRSFRECIVMGYRFALLLVLVLGLQAPILAQSRGELDFVTGLEEFREIRRMLPDFVHRIAEELLSRREEVIAGWSHPRQVEERRAYVRERFQQALGGPFPHRTPLNPRVVGVLERDGYRIEKIIFESQPRFYVTANLYLPSRGTSPYPGILFPLGHERGAKSNPTWQQVLGSLALKGFVSLAWDTIGQGERVQLYDVDFGESKVFRSTTEHTILGIQGLLAGDSLARYTIWDGIRALDYLLSRSEVDPNRIGCTGNSGGGTHTAYLAALDDRIHVAAPSCYLTSWRRLLETIGPQDAEQILLPWLRAGLDHPDFVHAFAPKPYLILSAIRDFFSISGARETYGEARRIYRLLGAEERIQMVEADDGHGYSKPRRLAAYDWFARWLKGTEDAAPEPEIEIATEQELFCTETGQVSTSLGGETVFSQNQKRVRQLARSLPRFANPEEVSSHRKEMADRLRRLAVYEPVEGPLPVEPFGEIQREGYRIEKLVYESEPGIRVPALLFLPQAPQSKRPAVLYADGRGKSAAAMPGGDIEQMVQAGFVVLSVDLRGMGETRFIDPQQASDFPRYFGDYDSAMTALLVSRPLPGGRMRDLVRGLDLLSRRDEVDTGRIYLFGKGSAAVPVLFAALLEDRIQGVCLEEMLLSYQDVVDRRIHRQVFENILWGALREFDFPELLAGLAPRSVWIVNPVNSLGHRVALSAAREHYQLARQAFRAAGAADRLQIGERSEENPVKSAYQLFR